jgi:hypothetical protein
VSYPANEHTCPFSMGLLSVHSALVSALVEVVVSGPERFLRDTGLPDECLWNRTEPGLLLPEMRNFLN